MRVKFSEDFKEFARTMNQIMGAENTVDLESTYDVIREEEDGMIVIISNGIEEKLPKQGYDVVEEED